MKKLELRWLYLFGVYVALSSPAYAYLDPATGSIAIQALIGAVATWIMYSKMFAAKAKTFFVNLVKRRSSPDAE
jgi:hypothetical protein